MVKKISKYSKMDTSVEIMTFIMRNTSELANEWQSGEIKIKQYILDIQINALFKKLH